MFVWFFSDWHDDGNCAATAQSRPPNERGHCVRDRHPQTPAPPLSRWTTSRHDWTEEALLRYVGQSHEETRLDYECHGRHEFY